MKLSQAAPRKAKRHRPAGTGGALEGIRSGLLHVHPLLGLGRFEDGVGTFYADDRLAGKPIRVRFLWTLPKPGQPRWEQAFSPDGGKSWETNWVMDFTRADAP